MGQSDHIENSLLTLQNLMKNNGAAGTKLQIYYSKYNHLNNNLLSEEVNLFMLTATKSSTMY